MFQNNEIKSNQNFILKKTKRQILPKNANSFKELLLKEIEKIPKLIDEIYENMENYIEHTKNKPIIISSPQSINNNEEDSYSLNSINLFYNEETSFENEDYENKEFNNIHSFIQKEDIQSTNILLEKLNNLNKKLNSNNILSEELFQPKKNGYSICNENKKKKIMEIVKIYGKDIISNKLNISQKNIGRWKKFGIKRKKGGGRKIQDPKMEENLLKYYYEMKEKGKLITSKELIEKAKKISNNIKFKGSKGWFEKKKKKYSLILKVRRKKNNGK